MKLDEVQGTQPDPEILIQGIGTMLVSQAIRNVRGKLEDLLRRANGPVTLENWQQIDALMKKETLQAFIESIAIAMRQIH